jgi:hypothetical protein
MSNIELIKQYADTGAILPKYQFDKLNNNLKNSYLRRRVMQAIEHKWYDLRDHEFPVLPKPLAIMYVKGFLDLHEDRFNALPEELKILHLEILVKRKRFIDLKKWKIMPDRLQFILLSDREERLSFSFFDVMSEEMKKKFSEHVVNTNRRNMLDRYMMPYLGDKGKKQYADIGGFLSAEELYECGEEVRNYYYNVRLNSGKALYGEVFNMAPDEYKLRALQILLADYSLPEINHLRWAPREYKRKFLKHGYHMSEAHVEHINEVNLIEYYLVGRINELKSTAHSPHLKLYEYKYFTPSIMQYFCNSGLIHNSGLAPVVFDRLSEETFNVYLEHRISKGEVIYKDLYEKIGDEKTKIKYLMSRLEKLDSLFDGLPYEYDEYVKYVPTKEAYYSIVRNYLNSDERTYIPPGISDRIPEELKAEYGFD